MRVFIAGVDGYLGWPLAQYMTMRGHEVGGIDMLLRRSWVEEVGGHSAIAIAPIEERLLAFQERFPKRLWFKKGNTLDYQFLRDSLARFAPDVIIHLAEMPSAAYSMIDQSHAVFTQQNNVLGSLNLLWAIRDVCPKSHLVKLGTMGEYGTPALDIPEGFFEVEYRGRKDYLPFPRQAGSFYHWSKVHDSNNIMFACKVWGLRATDIMQGVVFGARIAENDDDERLYTRLDFDECFGTVINRFCCQAVIGHPLTLYGSGGQTRGILPLQDSMQCLALSAENPPKKGEYRVFNQFGNCYKVSDLAKMIQKIGTDLELNVSIQHIQNPRDEPESHYYNPDRKKLIELGYRPSTDIEADMRKLIRHLLPNRDRIAERGAVLIPDIRWGGQQDDVHQPNQPSELLLNTNR